MLPVNASTSHTATSKSPTIQFAERLTAVFEMRVETSIQAEPGDFQRVRFLRGAVAGCTFDRRGRLEFDISSCRDFVRAYDAAMLKHLGKHPFSKTGKLRLSHYFTDLEEKTHGLYCWIYFGRANDGDILNKKWQV